jgi:hypothetical protein
MITITPTARPDAFAVDLVVAGAGGAPLTITAEPVGRDPYTVRAIGDPTADPATIRDHEAPFGVPIRYLVRSDAGSASALFDGLDVSGVVLSDTLRPGSATRVDLLTDRPHEWEARSAWFDVVDRRDPVVAVGPMRYRAGEWSIYARGNGARRALLDLLLPGAPLLLRSSCPEVVDDAIGLPLRVREEPHVDETGGRVFTIGYQAVTRTLGPYAGAADWTYVDLAGFVPTFDEVPAAFATYAALFAGPPTAPAQLPAPPAASAWGVPC